jgi:AcrR family transcriptional regulator
MRIGTVSSRLRVAVVVSALIPAVGGGPVPQLSRLTDVVATPSAARTIKPRTAPGEADAHVRQVLGAQQHLATVAHWLATAKVTMVSAPRRFLLPPPTQSVGQANRGCSKASPPSRCPADSVSTSRLRTAAPGHSGLRRSAGRPPGSGTAAATRTAALAAALDAITARGHERVRLRDIAERSGVAVGSLQYLFGCRAKLLLGAYSDAAERDLEILACVIAAPSPRQAFVQSLADERQGLGAQGLVRAELSHAALRDPDFAPLAGRVERDWSSLLDRAFSRETRDVALLVAGVGRPNGPWTLLTASSVATPTSTRRHEQPPRRVAAEENRAPQQGERCRCDRSAPDPGVGAVACGSAVLQR